MQRPLQIVAIAMASFSEGYQENSQIMKVATSLFNSPKYLINPEVRAQQVVNITRTADIQFCKAFWSITESEIMHPLPSLVYPNVQVDEVFHLGPDAFEMLSVNGEEITITPPCAHTGPAPVQVRLLSYQLREGQEQHLKSSRSPGAKTPSPKTQRARGLLIHCHGGGFVAQSSRSHEVYLRHWAKDLDVPILSVDYSLAPESPFPRALEECFYAYAWAVHNCEKLGSTGEIICMAGDSAGGNLVISTAMRASSFNIRKPDGILAVYTPVLVRYTPSPARLLSLMDPLLPAGILSRCLAAYAGVSDELSSQLAASVTCHIESSAATLNMSSQDVSESDWVLISQDSAARVNTTLSTLQQKVQMSGSSHLSSLERNDSQEEVELFMRPKIAVASVASTVADAKDKIMSYVGSCSQILVNSLSGWSAEGEVCSKTLQAVSSPGEESIEEESKQEESLETPSFYTPLTSPDEGQESLVSCDMVTGSTPNDGTDRDLSDSYSESTSDMLESPDNFFSRKVSSEMKSNKDAGKKEGSEHDVPDGLLASDLSFRHTCSRESDASLGKSFLALSSPCMPLLTEEKAQLLRQEVENSAFVPECEVEDQPEMSHSFIDDSSDMNVYEVLADENQTVVVTVYKEGIPPQDIDNAEYVSSPLSEGAKQSSIKEVANLKENLQKSEETGITVTKHAKEDQLCSKDETFNLSDPSIISNFQIGSGLKTESISTAKSDLHFSTGNLSSDSGCLSDDTMRPGPSVSPSCILSEVTVMDSAVSPSHLRRMQLHLDLPTKSSKLSLPRSASTPAFISPADFSRYSPSMSPSDFKRERHLAQSPLRAIRHIPIVKNPYMSPLLAPDSLLEGLPYISLVACHLDPLIDDSIMFTRRLRSLGKSIDLMMLDDLPHGFLNFSMLSQDAKRGSDICVKKLKEMLFPQ
ncbi:hormone-sensitive lipase-like isoform X2 [Pomacea canaliculata]|nr:hormone-sensitive lipase-like isoform X2 [Pomacea canaliculata]